MEFRIADTFTDSLAHLTGEEQKAVKTTAFDLQISQLLLLLIEFCFVKQYRLFMQSQPSCSVAAAFDGNQTMPHCRLS